MYQSEFTLPYYPSNSTRYSGANPVSILPRQSTSVQITTRHPPSPSSTPVLPIDMPTGPEYYTARRKAWLTPKSDNSNSSGSLISSTSTSTSTVPRPHSPEANSSRQRISDLLSRPGAIESDDTWNKGLQTLWRGLVNGSRFKRPLPLDIVIKILYAGWIRDGTWPAGSTIPDSPRNIIPAPAIYNNAVSNPTYRQPAPINSIPRPIHPPTLYNGFGMKQHPSPLPPPHDGPVQNPPTVEEEEDEAEEDVEPATNTPDHRERTG